jgi:DNA-directed RNA polymerase alpha subunit
MFISCKESRIENNRSFYGRFHLGTFEPGQSLTIANALRRSLLSDCVGVAIIALKIENVYHEYSTLPGVKDSILDIVLNFKEIVLKKKNNLLQGIQGYKNKGICSIYEQIGSTFFKPMIGYLKVKGPGIIRAKDLRLPPFLQCVDPNQYIATLADDGYLNVKFVVMEGKSYFIQKPNKFSHQEETPSPDRTKNIGLRHADQPESETPPPRDLQSRGKRSLKKTFQQKKRSRPVPVREAHGGPAKPPEFPTGTRGSAIEDHGVKGAGVSNSREIRMYNLLDSKNQSGAGTSHASSNKRFNESSSYSVLLNKRQNLLNQLTKIFHTSIPVIEDHGVKVEYDKPRDSIELSNYGNKLGDPGPLGDAENNPVFLRNTGGPVFLKKNIKEELSGDSGFNKNIGGTQLNIDAVFSPVTKVNYVIENTENYLIDSYEEKFKYIDNISSFIDSSKFLDYEANRVAFHGIKSRVFPHFNKKFTPRSPSARRALGLTPRLEETRGASVEKSDQEFTLKLTSNTDEARTMENCAGFAIENHAINTIGSDLPVLCNSDGQSHFKSIGIPYSSTIYDLSLNSNIDYIKQLFESNSHRTTKQIILLEIWTNGSLHPREALSMSFKNLSNIFSTQKLKMLNSIFNSSTSYKKTILKDH